MGAQWSCRARAEGTPGRRCGRNHLPGPDAILATMTAPTLDAEPACPGQAAELGPHRDPDRSVRAERRTFDSIPREVWDRMAARSPWATPFSSWAFHRAWWDGFGENANYQRESRHERAAPHLGRVELASIFCGALYQPLASVIDGPISLGGCAI